MVAEFLNALLPVTAFAVLLMLVIWRMALRINNLGIVDIAWSCAFAPVAIFCALTLHGDPTRRWLMAGMVVLWSLRLGTHVCVRVAGHHPQEDVRYAEIRAQWNGNFKLKLLLFFELQALLIAALSMPFLIVCLNPEPRISPQEYAGIALWLVAVTGEAIADQQLKQFRANPKNRGCVCRTGLWNYSRHPNYFFEWLVWMGFYLFALGSPLGCVAIYCPALMLYFLLRVTGIPLTEKLSVQSKGDAYREYQRTTSAFVPWFKKGSQTKGVKITL
jgi:steroid 5-alpha reductase family enzyme